MAAEPAVIVVDDDETVLESLRWLFASVGLAVEAHASADEFVRSLPVSRPGCLLIDVRMPGLCGLELLDLMVERQPGLPIIVMTAYGDVRMAVRAMKAGAFDFVEKPFNEQDLLELAQSAIDHGLDTAAVLRQVDEVSSRLDTLSDRQREVLNLIVEGEFNKTIAFRLGIGRKTVEFHRANVMRKMGAKTLADLIKNLAASAGPDGGS